MSVLGSRLSITYNVLIKKLSGWNHILSLEIGSLVGCEPLGEWEDTCSMERERLAPDKNIMMIDFVFVESTMLVRGPHGQIMIDQYKY